jgi:hypothetical protein
MRVSFQSAPRIDGKARGTSALRWPGRLFRNAGEIMADAPPDQVHRHSSIDSPGASGASLGEWQRVATAFVPALGRAARSAFVLCMARRADPPLAAACSLL